MHRFKRSARALRRTQTSAEARLWQALRNRKLAGWKFRRQHCIDRYIVDFVSLDAKLIIEVDGVTHATLERIASDSERTQALESFGFHVVRISNTDVYDNIEGVLAFIHTELTLAQAPLTRFRLGRNRPLPTGER